MTELRDGEDTLLDTCQWMGFDAGALQGAHQLSCNTSPRALRNIVMISIDMR